MVRRRDPAFCFGVGGKAKAPWRPTLDQAQTDAIDAGFAQWDEHEPEPGKDRPLFMHALAEIWTTHELVPVLPREVVPPRSKEIEPSPLSRIERIIARREGRMR
ncbi:hypothetical protein SAMN02927924_01657 [Sphingobium faniae]|nr:hypothetical protein SAMN02927924_01657 [Sphingobium faniae]